MDSLGGLLIVTLSSRDKSDVFDHELELNFGLGTQMLSNFNSPILLE